MACGVVSFTTGRELQESGDPECESCMLDAARIGRENNSTLISRRFFASVVLMSDVVAFNSQIVNLMRMGLPIAIGEWSSRHHIEAFLSDINRRFSETNVDASQFGEQIANDPALPSDYRSALRSWLHGNGLNRSMQPLYEVGTLEKEMSWSVAKYLSWVLVMIFLILVGMYLLIRKVYPELRGMYEISNLKATASLEFLRSLREWSTVALGVAFIVVAALLILWLTVPKWLMYMLPINRSIVATIRRAQQLELSCDDVRTERAKSDATVRSIVMREYAESSFRLSQRWLTLMGASLIVGLLVLGYALCLFWPFVEFLYQMSQG